MNGHWAGDRVSQVALVERARAGDTRAFDLLLSAHRSRIAGICLHWAHNTADAEDLMQETRLKAHRGLPSLSDPACFSAWLARIAVNTCRNWVTRERQDLLSLDVAEVRQIAQPERENETEEALVRDALEALPPNLRRAVEMFYIDGYTQDEMAILWRLPHSTVKGRLDMARRRLRTELQKMGAILDNSMQVDDVVVPNAIVALTDANRTETKALREALKAAGYTPHVIAREALLMSRLRRLAPDILILNTPFGSVEPNEILRAIRMDPKLRPIGVMFLVPKDPDEEKFKVDLFRAWSSGVDCYLTSPYSVEEVVKFTARIDQSLKIADYRSLAIEYAWRRETQRVLSCLRKAAELSGPDPNWRLGDKSFTDAVRDDPAFRYLADLPEFQALFPVA